MGRPRASKKNRQCGLLFAAALTVSSSSQELGGKLIAETVARSGPHSLFEVFSKVCPTATRALKRDGLTLLEFNKMLKQAGWTRVKFHSSVRQLREGDLVETTFYQFGGRRWRNPDDVNDMAALAQVWPQLSAHAACSLTLVDLSQLLRQAITADIALKAKGQTRLRMALAKSPSPVRQDSSPTSDACSESDASAGTRCSPSATPSHAPSSSTITASILRGHPIVSLSQIRHVSPASVNEDDEELQTKLAKERFSSEDLEQDSILLQISQLGRESSVKCLHNDEDETPHLELAVQEPYEDKTQMIHARPITQHASGTQSWPSCSG